MLSSLLRFFSVGSGVVEVGGPEAAADGAGGLATGAAGFPVVSGGVAGCDVRALSSPVAVCGVEAVETGGAPLLTDSGPQPLAAAMAARKSARVAKVRVLKGNI